MNDERMVKRYARAIHYQTYMMLHKRSFWVSFWIVMGYTMYIYFNVLKNFHDMVYTHLLPGSDFFCGKFTISSAETFIMAFPLIMTMTFAFTYFEERETGIINYTFPRVNRHVFYISKAIVAFLGNFMVIFIPYITNIALNFIFFPETNGSAKNVELYYSSFVGNNLMPYPKFYLEHTIIYLVIFSALLASFAGVLGIFAYSLSLLFRKYKILLFLPLYLLFYVFEKYPPAGMRLYNVIPFASGWKGYYGYNIFCICMSLLIISMVIIVYKCKKIQDVMKL